MSTSFLRRISVKNTKMRRKDELKEIGIKNRTCYCFDDMIRFCDTDIDFSDILLDKKLYKETYENISIYNISYKTPTGKKSLRIRFDIIDWFIVINDKVRCLALFDYSYYHKICDKIKYLTSEKNGTAYSINHNFTRIRIVSYISVPIEKILML